MNKPEVESCELILYPVFVLSFPSTVFPSSSPKFFSSRFPFFFLFISFIVFLFFPYFLSSCNFNFAIAVTGKFSQELLYLSKWQVANSAKEKTREVCHSTGLSQLLWYATPTFKIYFKILEFLCLDTRCVHPTLVNKKNFFKIYYFRTVLVYQTEG